MSKSDVTLSTNRDNMSSNGDSQGAKRDLLAFGQRLAKSAEFMRFSQASLAAALGISRQTIAPYWKGERMMPADILFRAAALIRVNPRWLVTGEGSENPPLEIDEETDQELDLVGAFRLMTDGDKQLVSSVAARLVGLYAEAQDARGWRQRTTAQVSSATLHTPKSGYRHEGEDDL